MNVLKNLRRPSLYVIMGLTCIALGLISGATLYAVFVIEPQWMASATVIRQGIAYEMMVNGWDFLANIGLFISLSSFLILFLGYFEAKPIKYWIFIYFGLITVLGALSILYIQPLELELIDIVVRTLSDQDIAEIVASWSFWNRLR
ncbi:MAG: hypothetical protein ACR2PH_12060, partial [Desulfobulbia bacterium]